MHKDIINLHTLHEQSMQRTKHNSHILVHTIKYFVSVIDYLTPINEKKQENYSQITLIQKHVLQYLSDFSRLIGRESNSP